MHRQKERNKLTNSLLWLVLVPGSSGPRQSLSVLLEIAKGGKRNTWWKIKGAVLELGAMKLRSWRVCPLDSAVKMTTPELDFVVLRSHQVTLSPQVTTHNFSPSVSSILPRRQPLTSFYFPLLSHCSPPMTRCLQKMAIIPYFSLSFPLEVGPFPSPLESGLSCDFLWWIKYGKSNLVPILILRLKRHLTVLFILLEPCRATMLTAQTVQLDDEGCTAPSPLTP